MKLRSLLPLALFTLVGCGSVDPSEPQQPTGGSGGVSSGGGSGQGGGGSGKGGGGSSAGNGAAGEGEAGDSAGPQVPLLPWAQGNQWTYSITKDGVTSVKTTTIGELEPVGGDGPNADVMAYHVVTAKGTELADRTESWQAADPDDANRIIRYREQSFDATSGDLELEEYWEPPKLHIDGNAERTATDASWLETYHEYKLEVGLSPTDHEVRERWRVVDADETLEVPAGTFEHVIHFQKIGGSSSKDYWYLRGVGKLKETGSQTEELVDYDVEEAR
jgi:hypothetical protein